MKMKLNRRTKTKFALWKKKKKSGEDVAAAALLTAIEEEGSEEECVSAKEEVAEVPLARRSSNVSVKSSASKKEEEAAAFGGDVAAIEKAVEALAAAEEEAKAEVLFDSSLLREREAKIAALEREVLSLRNQESEREKLGDMEVTLRVIKTSPISSPSPFERTDAQGLPMKDVPQPPTSLNSPTSISQFEYGITGATHRTQSYALMDEDKSISSEAEAEDSFIQNDDMSFVSDALSTHKKDEGQLTEFVEDVLSPMTCAADYIFCKMQCAFPNEVGDVDEILSSDLHHLIFKDDGGEEATQGDGASTQGEEGRDTRREDYNEDEEIELILDNNCLDEQGEGERGEGNDEGGADEPMKDEDEESVDEVRVLVEANVESASYSPAKGVVRKVGKLPLLSEDEVLIQVDATTISTRDCLERMRRNTNEDLKDEIWVPGHEIVGRVERTGTNSKSLLGKRIAALLPCGGGCASYVRIQAEDLIVLPEDADSNEVAALLSTYMTAYQCLESAVGKVVKVEEEGDDESVAPKEETSKRSFKWSLSGLFGNREEKKKRSPLYGKNVLIVGAGSIVGLALIDLARNAGANVYTVSHSAYMGVIREMGASHWYRMTQNKLWEADWAGAIDLIVDTVGDSNYNPSYYKVMKTRGRIVRVNITSCGEKYLEPTRKPEGLSLEFLNPLASYNERLFNDKDIGEYDVFDSFKADKELFEEDLAYLHNLLKVGKIGPKIVSQVGFDELEGEWEKLARGGTSGVVMVLPGQVMAEEEVETEEFDNEKEAEASIGGDEEEEAETEVFDNKADTVPLARSRSNVSIKSAASKKSTKSAQEEIANVPLARSRSNVSIKSASSKKSTRSVGLVSVGSLKDPKLVKGRRRPIDKEEIANAPLARSRSNVSIKSAASKKSTKSAQEEVAEVPVARSRSLVSFKPGPATVFDNKKEEEAGAFVGGDGAVIEKAVKADGDIVLVVVNKDEAGSFDGKDSTVDEAAMSLTAMASLQF